MKGPQLAGLSKMSLIELYVNDYSATYDSVGEKIGCSGATVGRWVHNYGLVPKDRSRKGARKAQNEPLASYEWLKSELGEKSFKQIARDLETTDHDVLYWRKKHNLMDYPTKTKSQAIKDGLKKKFPNGRSGKETSNWRGGRSVYQGYVWLHSPDHPNATQNRVQEHRLVMEAHLGRYLEPDEVVHHLNGIKDDNRLENLQVLTRGEHVSNHFQASHEVLAMRDRIKQLEDENKRLKQEIREIHEEQEKSWWYW